MTDNFDGNQYLIRRKFLTILGAKFHVYDPQGNLVLFSQQKAFKLREDIRVYADEAKTQERLWIKARQIIDFGASYDVVDSPTQQKLGALRRKGLKSILRDSWELLDSSDRPVGKIEEDNMGLAVIRRFLTNLVPQSFDAKVGGKTVARYKQRFNPFIAKLEVHLEPGAREALDVRLYLAAGILLVAVEGRQGG